MVSESTRERWRRWDSARIRELPAGLDPLSKTMRVPVDQLVSTQTNLDDVTAAPDAHARPHGLGSEPGVHYPYSSRSIGSRISAVVSTCVDDSFQDLHACGTQTLTVISVRTA